jgi:hypothetical protein
MLPIPKTPPISLSDEMMQAVMRAAQPLEPHDRSAFLEEAARAIATQPDLGVGSLHRLLASIQRKHFYPPREGHVGNPRHLGSKPR